MLRAGHGFVWFCQDKARLRSGAPIQIIDLPGIIEGAHRGRGLGHQFLRHIERTRTLAILIPVDDPEPTETYRQLCEELSKYSAELSRRPHCLVFTKSDLLAPCMHQRMDRRVNPFLASNRTSLLFVRPRHTQERVLQLKI